MRASLALLLSGLAAQQVSATWNKGAKHFNTPQYNNNECSDKQKEGFNWQGVPNGDFSGYGDFNFKGGDKWTCANSFGKRDSLTKRTFNSRCVKNKVKKDKPAGFDCQDRQEGFSVKEIQVSVEFDCDLEFHYKMPDGGTCKQTTSCKKEGTTVQNTQCGGAREVEVYLGNHGQKDRDDCEIGFHHIDFDCNPGYTPTGGYGTPPETTSTPPESTSSKPEESSTPPPVYSTSPPEETPSETPSESSPGYTAPETTAPPPESTAPPTYSNSTSAPPPPPEYTPSSSAPEDSTTTPEVPTGGYEVPSSSSGSPATETSVYTTAPPPESSVYSTAPPPESSSPPENPGYTPPECLPKCMNTWLEINTKCKDNTDSDCYCKNPDFTKSVIECVAAWSTDKETQDALQYLIGICASYVPENPGLITDCPSNIPINPTSPPTETPEPTTAPPEQSPPPAVPVTTITYDTTITVPCGCAESTSTVSTISTYVTVPQVTFSSETYTQPSVSGVPVSEPPVVLVPGTPPPVPASTTLPPYPTGGVPTTLGTGVVPTGSATVSSPAEFTGAASSVGVKPAGVLLGAVLAFFAL
jgi:hypothetical protein